jgi:hypothetical protein
MNAFEFGQLLGEKMAVGPAPAAAPAADPMAAERARRVAQIKADRDRVRAASGTPAAVGTGSHRWSGAVLPNNGGVQGAQYTGPAGASRQPVKPVTPAKPMAPSALKPR